MIICVLHIGTFLGKSAAESVADCVACYPGFYCPSWAQISADLLCPPGWFCPPGSMSGHQPGCQCPPGHACPHGSAQPAICSSGTFQYSSGQSTCNTCPPGFYCMEGSSVPSPCPTGHVSPSTGRTSLSDCSPCPPGTFCNSSALTEPSGLCIPGFDSPDIFVPWGPLSLLLSPSLMEMFVPWDTIVLRVVGHQNPVLLAASSQSLELPPPLTAAVAPQGDTALVQEPRSRQVGDFTRFPLVNDSLCFAGFFCSGGADSPTPRANSSLFSCLHEILDIYTAKTDAAFWMRNLSCFSNSSNSGKDAWKIEVVTAPQADSDHIVTHSPPCLKSPHYACSTYRGDICPRGFYCPLGSAYPQPCEAGFYCNQTGLEAPGGPCAAGYYCPKGSLDPHSTSCPTGHYCPLGTPLPLPCPRGTIRSSLGGATVEACQLCPPGHYCHQRGRAEPSGQCAEGYYCPGGQSSERPKQHVCSVGHYCEKVSHPVLVFKLPAVPDRKSAFQAAISSDKARAAVRHALLVTIVKIKE
ncbi:uncharacterized protein LOC130167724 [Seriola aureovittata]|uniref:uncharacterized protein LOC130167724 n=1 Tax=Seriola aureovittata TaxID=2871759 RepID=UPI0024BE2D03|nr:uncharacterized protein LOC130167724 [Seriola aureovittata]